MFIRSFVFPKKFFIFSLIMIFMISSLLYFSYGSENESEENTKEDKNFIKWVDFTVTSDALNKTANLDIKSHQNNEEIKYN